MASATRNSNASMPEPTETYVITLLRRWLAKIEGYIALNEQVPHKPMRVKYFSFDIEKSSDFIFNFIGASIHPFMLVVESILDMSLKPSIF